MSGLGFRIKSARLGYHPLPHFSGMLRLSFANKEETIIQCDLIPMDGDVRTLSKTGGNSFRVWWDDPSIIQDSPLLRSLRRIKKPFTITLDMKGKIIR